MKLKNLLWSTLVLFLFVGCAETIALRTSPDVPAAIGKVEISKTNNNNTRVEVEVKHLAPPQNLTPPKSVYVVWAQAPQGRTINLGQMIVGGDRSGEFIGITPLYEFRILITAEDLPAAASPGKQVVFSSEVFTVG